jgi:hypothetical protein
MVDSGSACGLAEAVGALPAADCGHGSQGSRSESETRRSRERWSQWKLVDAAAATWCGASVIVDTLEDPPFRRALDVKCLFRVNDL